MKTRHDTLDINNKLIWNLRDIGHTMRRVREGRGSQQRILILLRESGPTTQRELTARIGVQPGSASEAIAHRLSTIRDADLIVVMDQGRIVEQGRHDALLAKKGKCYDLYMTQLAGFAT